MLAGFELLNIHRLILFLVIATDLSAGKGFVRVLRGFMDKPLLILLLFTKTISCLDPKWLDWFIGFVEGDGSFFVTGGKLCFNITQKDIKVLHHIQEVLGFGWFWFLQSLRFPKMRSTENF